VQESAGCGTRPVTVSEFSIIADLIVMIMLAYFIRRAKIKAISDKAGGYS
jgi:hypothetical protein